MAWYRTGIAQTGGGEQPRFTETVLHDDATGALPATLSGDYHDYDFIIFETVNQGYSNRVAKFITTPSALDVAIGMDSHHPICLNELGTNQYLWLSYNASTYTFSYGNSRNLFLTKITGLTCSNMRVTEETIYQASTKTWDKVSITTDKDLFEYDMLICFSNSSDYSELQPQQYIMSHPCDFLEDYVPRIMAAYNTYDMVSITNHTMSASRYLYVGGIKFT